MNMQLLSKNVNENFHNTLKAAKRFFLAFWPVLLTGFIFSITRIRYLTYPLGLMHYQVTKEGFRSYEAITLSARFTPHIYIEQPLYVFLLQIGYIVTGQSPDGLVLWGRTIGFIFSAITLVLIYKISEITFGNIAAKFSAFLYSLSPYGIPLGIGIQRETLMWLFGLCAIFCLLKYLETNKQKYIFFDLAFSLLAIVTKFTGIYFLFTSLVTLILFYSGSPMGIKISVRKRSLLLFLFFLSMLMISLSFTMSNVESSSLSPLRHSIVFQPEVLLDTEFWSSVIVNMMLYIPITTALLGAIGLFLAFPAYERKKLTLIIWIVFTGMELIFYGNGTIIHEYYILYLLHPLVIFAGNTIFFLYQSNLKLLIDNRYIPAKFGSTVIMLFLFLSAGFIPWFYFTGEEKMIRSNEPFYNDIRSIGLFLKDYDIRGDEIVVAYLKENYVWWRFQLTLVRTYITKPRIAEFQISSISELVYSANYKAIIGWTDDLNQGRDALMSYFGNHTIFPQNTPFRTKFTLPSIELWYDPY